MSQREQKALRRELLRAIIVFAASGICACDSESGRKRYDPVAQRQIQYFEGLTTKVKKGWDGGVSTPHKPTQPTIPQRKARRAVKR
jgi:hypothetical protein